MQEKAQDNTSKQAAVEKEPLPLQKDKEDQSKYYLSYLKPPLLDMNWASRDVGWSNIPRFSTLDDTVTPLRLVEVFFNDALIDMIFGFTTLYSHSEKTGISFEITNEKIHSFLNMLLLSGCHKLPDRKMYWETTLYTFV